MHDSVRPEHQPSDSQNHMSGKASMVNPNTSKLGPRTKDEPETLGGYLLGQTVRYAQFRQGYRTGIEPVLLAAFVPANPGETVLEAGSGAGAGLLCLATRCAMVSGVGLEADPATAQLARRNLHDNNLNDRVTIVDGIIPNVPGIMRQLAPGANGRFHHALANPPWHPANHTGAHDPKRRLAMTMPENGWETWIATLSRWVLPGGSLTLALPAFVVDLACEILRGFGFGSLILYPLWPKQNRQAKIVLMRCIYGGRGVFRLLPGLVLHTEQGGYTKESEAILRLGQPISLRGS